MSKLIRACIPLPGGFLIRGRARPDEPVTRGVRETLSEELEALDRNEGPDPFWAVDEVGRRLTIFLTLEVPKASPDEWRERIGSLLRALPQAGAIRVLFAALKPLSLGMRVQR